MPKLGPVLRPSTQSLGASSFARPPFKQPSTGSLSKALGGGRLTQREVSAPKLSSWVLPAFGGQLETRQVQSPIGPSVLPARVTLRSAGEASLDGAFIARGDLPLSGRLSFHELPGVTSAAKLPDDAPRVKLLHISGIDTNAVEHGRQLHRLAKRFAQSGVRAELLGMHNGSDGTWRDLAQATADVLTFGRGNNRCIGNLRDQIVDSVLNRNQLNVFAHSQGAIILSRALTEAKASLVLEHGFSREQAFSAVDRHIRGATYGGATSSFTNDVLHFYNPKDGVAAALGVGLRSDAPSGPTTLAGLMLAPTIAVLRKFFHTEPLAPADSPDGRAMQRGEVALVESKANGPIEAHRAKTYAESMKKKHYTQLTSFFSVAKRSR